MAAAKTLTMREAFDRSIRAAIRDGVITRTTQSALIRAGQKLAAHMDLEGWPMIDGKLDTSTAPTLLKYMQVLGLAPDLDKKATASSKLEKIREMAAQAESQFDEQDD